MLLKFFVVLTCICFWIELVWGLFRRGARHSARRRRHHHHSDS